MKLIKLKTPNFSTIVDDDDEWWISIHKWYLITGDKNYVTGYFKGRMLLLHRIILNITDQPDKFGDHINGNTLDNRRENLRIATKSQNAQNSKKWSSKTDSKYKGVSWKSRDSKWRANIRFNGKQVFLGTYINEIDAAFAYDLAAKELFGDFAALNFPDDTDTLYDESEYMSHYTTIELEIKDVQCFIEAIVEHFKEARNQTLTAENIEVHAEPTHLYGYRGDRREQLANIIIRRNFVGGASNDLGFFIKDGKCTTFISEFDQGQGYNQRWLNKVRQKYACNVTKKAAIKKGYAILSETVENGKIKLRVGRPAFQS